MEFCHIGQDGLEFLTSNEPPTSAFQSAGITGGESPHPAIFFLLFSFFFIKTGFHHVGQAGLELLTSGDLPALASKVLGLQV